MGIWTQKDKPVAREPVVLINDPLWAERSPSCGSADSSEPSWCGDLVIEIELETSSSEVGAGLAAFVTCGSGQRPAVFVSEPQPHRVGQLVGPGAHEVEALIRRHHSGLRATICNEGPVSSFKTYARIAGTERKND